MKVKKLVRKEKKLSKLHNLFPIAYAKAPYRKISSSSMECVESIKHGRAMQAFNVILTFLRVTGQASGNILLLLSRRD
jgi:hypothetical protein